MRLSARAVEPAADSARDSIKRPRRFTSARKVLKRLDELAVARAPADLPRRLLSVTSADIAQFAGPTSW